MSRNAGLGNPSFVPVADHNQKNRLVLVTQGVRTNARQLAHTRKEREQLAFWDQTPFGFRFS